MLWEAELFLLIINLLLSPTQLLSFQNSAPKATIFLTFYVFSYCLHPHSSFYWPHDHQEVHRSELHSLVYKMKFLSLQLLQSCCKLQARQRETHGSFQLQIFLALKTCSKAWYTKKYIKAKRLGEKKNVFNY